MIRWMTTALLLTSACGGRGTPPANVGEAATDTPTATAPTTAVARPHPQQIDRATLFGDAPVGIARMSPDGQQLVWTTPSDRGWRVLVAPIDDLDDPREVLDSEHHPGLSWAYDGASLLAIDDHEGDENDHVYRIALDDGTKTDLTPYDGVRARLHQVSAEHPHTVWVELNDRDPALHDLYAIDLRTGERTLVYENREGFASLHLDRDGAVRLATQTTDDGGKEFLVHEDGAWSSLFVAGFEDSETEVLGFDDDGRAYLQDSRDRDATALVAIDLPTRTTEVISERAGLDLDSVSWSPVDHRPDVAIYRHTRQIFEGLHGEAAADLAWLAEELDAEPKVLRSTDDRYWSVFAWRDGPLVSWHFDRQTRTLTPMQSVLPALEQMPLVPMHSRVIPTRDGLEMVSYLSLPSEADPDGDGRPDAPVPLVLMVHGGPWGRVTWGFNQEHQLFANRGYAVIEPNFRGSTGFGKAFVNASTKQWGRAMQDDLLDAVDWAVAQGITTPDKVAIYGGSYGGYATLAGLAFTPDRFACGVDHSGPSNLETLIASIPPYWKPMLELVARRMGDPRTEEGRALLAERSPVNFAEQIRRPLLISQGANDPRVKVSEAEQIVDAMQGSDTPVTYLLFPDEGHGVQQGTNREALYSVTEVFLAQCLGGAHEPVDITASSVQVPTGAEHVPGLAEALRHDSDRE